MNKKINVTYTEPAISDTSTNYLPYTKYRQNCFHSGFSACT